MARLLRWIRLRSRRGTLFDWQRAGYPDLFILATGSKLQHVSIELRKEGEGFLIVHDLLGDVAYQVEPNFDEACRWALTRFAGAPLGWWVAPRFRKRAKRQPSLGEQRKQEQ